MITHGTLATGPNDPVYDVSVDQWGEPHTVIGIPMVAELTLANDELLGLSTTHMTVVGNPGAGKWIFVLSAWSYFKRGSSGFTTDDSDPTLGYGNGYNPFNGNFKVAGQAEDAVTFFDLTATALQPPTELVDKAINVEAVGTLSGGVGCQLKVGVVYVVLDVP